MLRRYVGSAFVLILLFTIFRSTARGAELPKVLVLATGGTIAGEPSEPGTMGPYEIRKSVSEVVALVPDVKKYAQVETEQFLNIASSSITPDNWIQLARR